MIYSSLGWFGRTTPGAAIPNHPTDAISGRGATRGGAWTDDSAQGVANVWAGDPTLLGAVSPGAGSARSDSRLSETSWHRSGHPPDGRAVARFWEGGAGGVI